MEDEIKKKTNAGTVMLVIVLLLVSAAIGYGLHEDTVGYQCTNNITDMQVCDESGNCETISGESRILSFVYGESDVNSLTGVVIYDYYDNRISKIIGYNSRINTAELVDKELLKGCERL